MLVPYAVINLFMKRSSARNYCLTGRGCIRLEWVFEVEMKG